MLLFVIQFAGWFKYGHNSGILNPYTLRYVCVTYVNGVFSYKTKTPSLHLSYEEGALLFLYCFYYEKTRMRIIPSIWLNFSTVSAFTASSRLKTV